MSTQKLSVLRKDSKISPAPWRIIALWSGLSLGWEIFIALMIKIALVIGIKMAFFSDPMPKQEAANAVANVFNKLPVVEPNTVKESLSSERKQP